VEEAWETLAGFLDEGKVRHIGVSNFSVDQLRRAETIAPVETLQPPYSLLTRGIEGDLLPYCREKDIGVIVYSPMASGLLTGAMTRERIQALPDDDWRKTKNPDFQEPRLTKNLELVERLREIGDGEGVGPGAIAIAWALRHPEVSGAIVGMRKPEQVAVVEASEVVLADEVYQELTNRV
jgi:aryl-alcohol dehydrogenase-like predicted oxidoreductase